MSKAKSKNKKVKVIPTASKLKSSDAIKKDGVDSEQLLFNRTNYLIILAGFFLILVGMLLMIGGHMPSPDVWDDNLIYSFRITVVAPIVILIGLSVGGYGIFKK